MADPAGRLPSLEELKARATRVGQQHATAISGVDSGEEDSGGVLGALKRIPGDLVSGSKDIATGIVPGVLSSLNAGAKDVWGITEGDFDFNRSRTIAEAALKSTIEDFRHPLRNPAATLLSAFGVLSLGAGTAARGAAALGAIREGAAAGKVARAAIRGPKPEARYARLEGEKPIPVGTYSKSALTRQIQKQFDVARENNPNKRYPLRTQKQRYGRAKVAYDIKFAQKADRALANQLLASVKKLTAPQQRALVYYAQNVPTEKRIQYHTNLIEKMNNLPEVEKALRLDDNERELVFLRAAEPYVETVNGDVQWKPGTENLQGVYKQLEDLVSRNEEQLREVKLMTQAGQETRTQAPAAKYYGAKFFSEKDYAKLQKENSNRIKIISKQAEAVIKKFDRLRTERPGVAAAEKAADVAGRKASRLRERAPSAAEAQALLDENLKREKNIQRAIDRATPAMQRFGVLKRFFENASPEAQAAIARLDLRENADQFANAESARGAALREVADLEAKLLEISGERASIWKRLADAKAARAVAVRRASVKNPALRAERAADVEAKSRIVDLFEKELLNSKASEASAESALRDARKRVRDAERNQQSLTRQRVRDASKQESDLAKLKLEYDDLKSNYESFAELLISQAAVQEKIIEYQTIVRVARAKDAREANRIIDEAQARLRQANNVHIAAITDFVNRIGDLNKLKASLEREIEAKAADVGKFIGGEDAPKARLYIPYSAYTKAAKSTFKTAGMGQRGIVGVPKKPSFLMPFKGSLIDAGGGRWDQVKLFAERRHEAIRYIFLLKFRNDLIAMAKDVPTGMKNPVAIRLDAVKNERIPVGLREIISNATNEDVVLSKKELEVLGSFYDEARKELFDKDLSRRAKYEKIASPIPGYKWVEKDMLGGLDVPSPLVGLESGAGKVVLSSVDAINDLTRFVTLYLRPATIVPNILSGIALNLVQQGFLAPINIAKAFFINKRLGPYERFLIDEYMGEGSRASYLRGSGSGRLGRMTTATANLYGKIQDVPFRRASFLHEARREGFVTNKELRELLTKPENQEALFRVQDRANRAIIDYSDLGPREAALLRRVFFFYPWIKGATKYTGRMIQENPVQSLAYSQMAQEAAQKERELFGLLPSYARGILQTGERDGVPLTVQTQGILPFSTAVEPVQAVADLLFGVSGGTEAVLGSLSPIAGSGISTLTGRNEFGIPLPKDRGIIEQFVSSIAEGTPAAALIRNLTSDTSERAYPVSPSDAWRTYLISNILASRPTNIDKLQQLGEAEAAR